MRAGDANRRVTIRRVVRTDEAGGGYAETLVDVATVWAEVEPLQGDEQLQAMQTGMARPHRFTLRYREGVDGATELLHDGRRFNVRSVTDTRAARRELVILADEVRA
jgi:SPP1 family predicted phage head-tail adaptor